MNQGEQVEYYGITRTGFSRYNTRAYTVYIETIFKRLRTPLILTAEAALQFDKLVFHVVASVHLKMSRYNTYVYERARKLTLVNITKERKSGITALAKS